MLVQNDQLLLHLCAPRVIVQLAAKPSGSDGEVLVACVGVDFFALRTMGLLFLVKLVYKVKKITTDNTVRLKKTAHILLFVIVTKV